MPQVAANLITGRDEKSDEKHVEVGITSKDIRIRIPKAVDMEGVTGLKRTEVTDWSQKIRKQECICAVLLNLVLIICFPAIVFVVLTIIQLF